MTRLNDLKQAEFESERLMYRGIRKEDSADIVQWRSDEEIYRYFYNPRPLRIEDHLQWFEHYLTDEARFDFLVMTKENRRTIGIVGLQNLKGRTADLSYMIGEKQAWGKRYGTEAIKALSAFAFRELNLEKLTAVVHAKNIASQKAVQRAGYEQGYIAYELSRGKA